MVRYFMKFTGRVQGVGFRFFASMHAENCHLTGWVKNMPDGSVTAEVQGSKEQIQQFKEFIRTGHRFMRVDQIDAEERPICTEEKGFKIQY